MGDWLHQNEKKGYFEVMKNRSMIIIYPGGKAQPPGFLTYWQESAKITHAYLLARPRFAGGRVIAAGVQV